MKLLSFKSNMMLPGQWMFKIGRPNMGPFNVESADSFSQKGSLTPLYFNVDQCKYQFCQDSRTFLKKRTGGSMY